MNKCILFLAVFLSSLSISPAYAGSYEDSFGGYSIYPSYKKNKPKRTYSVEYSYITNGFGSYPSDPGYKFITAFNRSKNLGYINEDNLFNIDLTLDYYINLIDLDNSTPRFMYGPSGISYINDLVYFKYGVDLVLNLQDGEPDVHPHISFNYNINKTLGISTGISYTMKSGVYTVAGFNVKTYKKNKKY